jgi:hypothetical protein
MPAFYIHSSDFEGLAAHRYPLTHPENSEEGRRTADMRKQYIAALIDCKKNPAYMSMLPTGVYYPCYCEPLMPDDTKGWRRVKARTNGRRTPKEPNMDNYEDF